MFTVVLFHSMWKKPEPLTPEEQEILKTMKLSFPTDQKSPPIDKYVEYVRSSIPQPTSKEKTGMTTPFR